MSESSQAYRVLARKYRPQRFSELIGQDAMVTTLGNAIRRGRLAHAFLMTGVRGVGKTSTARLIAKALNCIGPDGQGGPTIDPCGQCDPCRAIAEGRFIDVLEQDAASNTKVEQMRDLLDTIPYAPVSARFKVYIIDEVHMLSNASFNALLKTLEEPPPHVKFIFATTEVHKVPVTILSRCQRFDLRRIPAELLAGHFAHVCAAEGVAAEPEALALVARAAEGSARDGLSILDQAIAHADLEGEGQVTAAQVRDMLGLSDRGAIRRLFGAVLAGDAAAALAGLRAQYDHGVDPATVLRGLLETVHGVTLERMGAGADPAQSAEEREALAGWAARLSFVQTHRLWQLLLKGHDEVVRAPMPIEAAEMALLRVIHAAELPDPAELVRRLARGDLPAPGGPAGPSGGGGHAGAPQASDAPVAPLAPASGAAEPAPSPDAPADFRAFHDLVYADRPRLALHLHDDVGLIHYAPPLVRLRPLRPLPGEFLRDLVAVLRQRTGMNWTVELVDGAAAPSLLEQERAAEAAARQAILDMPVVSAAFAAFPDAELIDYSPAMQARGRAQGS
ncbi:DNA polymerase III subunit gamma/tau [Sphingomonas changnyeongensis]|uniref:DNA polymerase III subunit gamma/tau n=1 Tax=Sphingomonas changnyeongensis TaxID=2698679 RepID=A0A7Z2NWU6_9SPHN|nr:DNA polymerase III subunit gamma/tau [Sphingomonas changnyeongensis]QHL90820.1 DNA polymerase III subunit gamma/tau [Sphingomonas changnyeongensis]